MEESIASDAEASSEAAGDEYERRDIQSLSSGDLDCTSTPVAIGQDPFAKCSDTHGAAGPFRYRCSKAGSRCLASSCAVMLPWSERPLLWQALSVSARLHSRRMRRQPRTFRYRKASTILDL